MIHLKLRAGSIKHSDFHRAQVQMRKDYQSNAERLIEGAERAAREHWRLLLIEGIGLVLFGTLALFIPSFVGLGLASSIGWTLLSGGIAALVLYSRIYRAPGYRFVLSAGIFAAIAGLAVLIRPWAGVISLTVILIICFALIGVAKLTYPLERNTKLAGYRRWIRASGAIDLVLAAVIFMGLPENALWAPGLLFAANMIVGGIALVVVALRERLTADPGETTQR
ncbi:MAG TPA: DUF308 domain-containing protein [Bradyrhizobium sp.]|nr:DUF308 domain-containing protein [Bradyrhizobium sp.]